MGTTDFAAACLDSVIKAGHDVPAVCTQPDRPKNRGMKLAKSPVKEYAEAAGIRVMQPVALRSDETEEEIRSLGADIFVVVAYGRILPQRLLELPRLGCVNVHASLLPKYRGAAPIQWAVLEGEKEIGVTTMYLDREMDTGDMIDRASLQAGEYESFGSVYKRLMPLGAQLIVKTLDDIENGRARAVPQNSALATYAPPITKEMCRIDWSRSPRRIADQIRALDPKPGAAAVFGQEVYKLFSPRLTEKRTDMADGSIVSRGDAGLEIACGGGHTLLIGELQAPGGRRMSAADYLRGHAL